MWTLEDIGIFQIYCPSKRDNPFHSMAIDTSSRPHELLGLQIEFIVWAIK